MLCYVKAIFRIYYNTPVFYHCFNDSILAVFNYFYNILNTLFYKNCV